MIYLIGFMGVGKTTIAKKYALENKINFTDIDKEIEKNTNKNILNIFNEHGEDYFRKLETLYLKKISKGNIVACGGGLPINKKNLMFLKKSGITIYLKASRDVIFERLLKNTKKRPLIYKKSENDLKKFINLTLKKREKVYLKADFTIDTTNLSEKETLRKINALLATI